MIRTAAGKFGSAVKNHRMLEGRKTAVVGFSGGADSALLLVMMAEVLGTGNVLALHVNHMIRGEEADRDEKFCRDFCSERGIPFRAVRVDIPAGISSCKTSHRTTFLRWMRPERW